ncbi:hypothetical protein Tco_0944855 [Tanacetum coccineum]
MAKGTQKYLWPAKHLVSEQRLESIEKGTEIGVYSKATKKGKSRTDWFLRLFCDQLGKPEKILIHAIVQGEVQIRTRQQHLIIPGVLLCPEVTTIFFHWNSWRSKVLMLAMMETDVTYFPMFKDRKIHHLDEDRMRKMQNQYLQDYFESIASKEGMEQEIVRIKGNL